MSIFLVQVIEDLYLSYVQMFSNKYQIKRFYDAKKKLNLQSCNFVACWKMYLLFVNISKYLNPKENKM